MGERKLEVNLMPVHLRKTYRNSVDTTDRLRVFTQVVVTDIKAANPGRITVNDNNLTVITEVKLEFVMWPLAGIEWQNLDTLGGKICKPIWFQTTTAQFVIENIYR